jgi:hypothetical protein
MLTKDQICQKFLDNPEINPEKGTRLRRNMGPFNGYVDLCRELGYNDEVDILLGLKQEEIKEEIKIEYPEYAVYKINDPKTLLAILKPRLKEVVYTHSGMLTFKFNVKNKLPYAAITNVIVNNKNLVTIPYNKDDSVEDISYLIKEIINIPEYEIKDIDYTEYPIYTGKYSRYEHIEKSLKETITCQTHKDIRLDMASKGTEWYNTFLSSLRKGSDSFKEGEVILGKNDEYIITSSLEFNEILNDIDNCGKIYYMINTSKHIGKIFELAEAGHAMAIVIDPALKLLEIYDPNGLTPDTKHVYFWANKLIEYLNNYGIKLHRKMNIDEPYCPQSVTEYVTNEGQCLIWSYWYIWLRINNPEIPSEVIRVYMAKLSPSKAFDRISRIASKIIDVEEKTEAVYSITGPRKIIMLRKIIDKEVIYTPYGVEYLKLDKNNLPSYHDSLYITDIKNKGKFVSIAYQKGRSEDEINRLIKEKLRLY